MDYSKLRQSASEVSSHANWLGSVTLSQAAKQAKSTEQGFVLSSGIRGNHYILTCALEDQSVEHHSFRYDIENGGWKNFGCPIFNSLEALVESHLPKSSKQVSA